MLRTSTTTLPLLRRWRACQVAVHHQQPYTTSNAPSSTPTPTTHAAVVAAVAATLARLGVPAVGLNAEVCDGLLMVDLALQSKGKLVAVDVTPRPAAAAAESAAAAADDDATPQRAWAMQQMRRQALKAHGWSYVQLPAVEWLSLLGDADEEDVFVRERVLKVVEEEDAHVCGSGCAH